MDIETFLARHRVAHLATVSAEGAPHVVPVVYAIDGKHIYIALDEKRKSAAPMQLKRVRNIQANPRVTLIVDDYSERWERLAWVRVDGVARIVQRGKTHDRAVKLLRDKYRQYRTMRLEERPVIAITIRRTVSWQA